MGVRALENLQHAMEEVWGDRRGVTILQDLWQPQNWLNLGVKPQEHMETNEWGYKRELVFSSWFSCYHSHLASKTPQDGSPHKNALGPQG